MAGVADDVNPVDVEGLESLTPLVDQLGRTWKTLRNFDEEAVIPILEDLLPSIAVVGGPGSGKSSVLETLMQNIFIPTAAGTATRCPLVLQLQRVYSGADYAKFAHSNDRYIDKSTVIKEIETICLNNRSSEPIHLSIFSQDVVNIHLLDLPGLTEGQPENTSVEIMTMARAFIKKQNCIILFVSAANQDLVSSDAIKISQEFDPEGQRTFGVLTKVDLMDNFTDVLEQRSSLFKFQWTCVHNRSQQDIENNVNIADSLLREKFFFSNKSEHKHASSMGSYNLANKISKVLKSLLNRTIMEMEIKLNPVGTRFINVGPPNSVPWVGLPKRFLAPVRSQGKGKNCALQAGMVVMETHHIVDAANKEPSESFMYTLSLSDFQKSYDKEYPHHASQREAPGGSMRNTIRLLKKSGVYGHHKITGVKSVVPFKIRDFRHYKREDLLAVIALLDAMKALLANFRCSTNYDDLMPGQVYRYDSDNKAYNSQMTEIGHAVMIVGYCMDELQELQSALSKASSPEEKTKIILESTLALAFQNSYGTAWGVKGGYGYIEASSVNRYYLPIL